MSPSGGSPHGHASSRRRRSASRRPLAVADRPPLPPRGKRRVPRRQAALWAILSVLMAGASATVAYLVGHTDSSAPAEAAAPRLLRLGEIYASGRSDGYRAGRERAERAALSAGYEEGLRDGRKSARSEARRRYARGAPGFREIFRTGFQAGALQALGEYREWQPGSFYIVSVGSGERGSGKRISSRSGPIEAKQTYRVCADGARVCVGRSGK
jgi:hypothetical protein